MECEGRVKVIIITLSVTFVNIGSVYGHIYRLHRVREQFQHRLCRGHSPRDRNETCGHEKHGITAEARISFILNVFMYIDDCIDIQKYADKNKALQ